jgi:hypothetical protein
VKVVSGQSCRHRIVCPFFAVRSSRKRAFQLSEKLQPLVDAGERFQFLTITQRNSLNLDNAFSALLITHRKFMQARRNDLRRGGQSTFFSNYRGGIYSIEIKRGRNSGMWHPHIHYLVHGRGPLTSDYDDKRLHPLSIEMCERSKGSFICDVRDIDTDSVLNPLFEVCKYVHDFKCDPVDVWQIQDVAFRRRMSGSFGDLRGLKSIVDDNDPDDVISPLEARQFVDYFLQWAGDHFDVSKHENAFECFEWDSVED